MKQKIKKIGTDGKERENKLDLSSGAKVFENSIEVDRAANVVEQKWLTTIEAAEYLRVSVGSLKNMVYRGQVSPRKLGRLNRFLRDELDRSIRTPFTTKGALSWDKE